jgi:hypothetical protein
MLQRFLPLAFFLLPVSLVAQISHGGAPMSYSLPLLRDVAAPTLRPTGFNAQEVADEDMVSDALGRPPRFAVLLPAGYNVQNSGEWTTVKGGRVWRLRIETSTAQALTLMFDAFRIPQGGRVFVFNDDRSHFIGSFNHLNNEDGGNYATQHVLGKAVTVEYFEPTHATGLGVIEIGQVGHCYRMVVDEEADDAAGVRGGDACQVDVNCTPEGTNWQDEKRGVVRVAVVSGSGQGWCSASMVNNTALNCRNFVLTALHCGDNSTANNFGQYVFYFNFELPGCGTGTASQAQSMTGCSKRAESNDGGGSTGSDFMLLELNSTPPANYNVYYNGWNRQNVASTSGVSIHHPAGGRKKVSTYTSALQSAQWGSASGSHWSVVWAATANGHGVTEGGSSGSPIFNNAGLIVGTLTGGGSFCNSPTSPDEYGKMSYHWSSNPGDDLSVWLDPTNSGVNSLAGTYAPCAPAVQYDGAVLAVVSPSGSICATSVTPVVTIRNLGSATLTTLRLTYNIDGGTNLIFNWSGSLVTNATANVTLPIINGIASGAHVFNVVCSLPNGQTDGNAANNSASSNFSIVNADSYVTLRLLTDNYGAETTWTLTQNGGGTVASGGPYTTGTVGYVEQDLCVQSGQCYTFTINDSEGDGICCEFGTGNYSLGDAGGYSIWTGAAFAASEQVQFCVPAAGAAQCDTVLAPFSTVASGYTIYANPNGGYIAGSNSFGDVAKAQAFPSPSGNFEVAGVAYWTAAKANAGASVAVNLYDRNGAGTTTTGNVNTAPGTVLATVSVPLARVDTAGFINYAAFPNAVTIGSAYAVGLDFTAFGANDQLGIVTNVDGDAGNAERSWEKWDDNTWHTMDAGWNSNSNGKFDLGIFPVLCPVVITGVPAEGLHHLMVFPNPSEGLLNIGHVLNAEGDARIEVLTATGQSVYSRAVTHGAGQTTIDLSAEAAGIYLVRMQTPQGSLVRRWVKQ